MDDPSLTLVIAAVTLAGLAMLVSAGLSAWRGWLRLKERQLAVEAPASTSPAGARIELSDLKERVRRLEAIAAGVDL